MAHSSSRRGDAERFRPSYLRDCNGEGPAPWRAFLESQQSHVAARHRQFAELLGCLDTQSRNQRIPFVALKGAALHANGIYVAGDRPMADLDLLVQAADREAMTNLLVARGFAVTFTSWRRHQLFELQKPRDAGGGAG